MSPTVLRMGPYRCYFYSNEPSRPNVHCRRDEDECKFWLEKDGCPDVSLKDPGGFSAKELKDIREVVEEHHFMLLQNYYVFHNIPSPSYRDC